MEDKIVTKLKELISESDYLLNLHDGSGYYYPEYIDKWRNPSRFGQSVIADCREYRIPGTGRVIRLEEIANKFCKVFALVTLREMAQGNRLEYAYHVKLRKGMNNADFIEELKRIESIKGVRLLLQETTVEL